MKYIDKYKRFFFLNNSASGPEIISGQGIMPRISFFWENLLSRIIFISVSFLICFHSIIWQLIISWKENHYYYHGFLIPLISLYLIFQKRKEIRQLKVKSSPLGIIIIVLSLVGLITAKVFSASLFISSLSMVCFIYGGILFIFGKEYGNALVFPIFFLLFMIPMPSPLFDLIIYPLQLTAAKIGKSIFELLGIPVFRQGINLYLPSITITVAESCSSMHTLIALSALSFVVAYFFTDSIGKSLIVVATSIPLGIFTNGCRLVLIILLALWKGRWVLDSFLHPLSGKIFFLIALSVLVLEAVVLNKVWKVFKERA